MIGLRRIEDTFYMWFSEFHKITRVADTLTERIPGMTSCQSGEGTGAGPQATNTLGTGSSHRYMYVSHTHISCQTERTQDKGHTKTAMHYGPQNVLKKTY
jgi:hypothetical protein